MKFLPFSLAAFLLGLQCAYAQQPSASTSIGIPQGPPGMDCTSHLDHFDCTTASGEESICELNDSVWVCEVFESHGHEEESTGESESSGSSCVVHGGHTHGDCSGQCNNIDLGEYNQDLHIVALFVLLVASAFGVFLPIVSSGALRNKVSQGVFFAARHFGTGIILSTALIHLLYHAFVMFGNACLGELVFEPAAPAITLAGLFLVFLIDYCAMRMIRKPLVRSDTSSEENTKEAGQTVQWDHHGHAAHNHSVDYSSPQAHFDVNLLEAGIIFHSIMIGVTLGASGGSQWKPLFIAIVFHQLFEGLALGSRIGLLEWQQGKAWKKWVMAAAFALITPIGVAIGIGVHASYNPNSGAALLSIGILDSISAGILLYAGIVELLVHDFMHGEMAHAGKVKVISALGFLLAGMLCMSILGKWA